MSSGGGGNGPRGAFPDGWEQAQPFYVYQAPKLGQPPLKNTVGKNQGIWKESFSTVPNPCELWTFDERHVPTSLLQSSHPFGVWGYKPGADIARCPPEDVWFFPPKTKKLPKYFTPLGKWSFPVRKRDISSIAPEKAGFLTIGTAEKVEKLDVGGTWRMLYQRDGEPKGRKPPPPPMKIHVQKPNGTRLTITPVEPTDTIGSIKQKIQDLSGIPIPDQRLNFNAQLLDDDQPTLDDCGIQDEDTLVLAPMIIHVKDAKDTDKKYTLQVEPTDTIADVKNKLEQQEGIPKAQQRLTYKQKPLLDKPTLRDYEIPHEGILQLEPMQIHVQKPNGNTITLNVDPTDQIQDIKQKVQSKEGTPVDEQRLLFDGNELDDTPTLKDYNIQHGDTLKLDPMKVHVRTPKKDKTMTFTVKPNNTIDDIKQMVYDAEGIPKADQRLLQDGDKPLNIGERKLKDCGIQHDDTLDLEGMHIIIKDWTGHKFPLYVEPTDTIDSIKEQIEDEKHIPKDRQYLLYGGTLLDDPDQTLQDHNIKHKDVVNLDRMKIYIQDWKGKTFTLEVDPTDTIQDVKQKIQDRENVPVKEQLLKFHGTTLNNPKTLDDCGVQYLDTLNLEKGLVSPQKSPKPKIRSAPVTPQNREKEKVYTIQLSPWQGLENGYKKKGKITREGKKAKSKELFKDRWHTDLESEVKELGLKSMEKHSKKKTEGKPK